MSKTLKVIGECMFSGCRWLKRIDLPDSLERLEDGVFFNCFSLAEINGEIEIEIYTFEDCDRLRAANLKIIQKSR